MKHRCSSLPCTFACPGSLAPNDAPYDPQNDWAKEGDSEHSETAAAILAGAENASTPLADKALAMWKKITRNSKPVVETHLKTDWIGGHPDVYELCDDLDCDAIVVDWKFGYVKRDHRDQLLGYAWLLHQTRGVEVVKAYSYYPRLNIQTSYTFDMDDFADFVVRLRQAEADAGKRYAPGDHCRYCAQRLSCAAYTSQMRQGVEAMVQVDAPGELTPAKLVELYPMAKQVEKALASYYAACKQVLRSGAVESNGHRMRFEYRTQERLVAHKAKKVILDELGQGTWDKACKVSKKQLVKAARDEAPQRGLKAIEAERQLLASLKAADAMTTSQTEMICYERIKED